MHTPLVSTVLAVKNGARFLAEALESVCGQDYSAHEVIVVDGQSEDDSLAIARRFAGVRCIPQTGPPGIASARNIGIDAARGEFVAFASCDDLWVPNKLRTQVAYFERHPRTQYTIARVRFFLEPGCSPPAGFRPELLEGDHVGPMPETLMARRTLFEELGAFETGFSLMDDNEWISRMRDQGVAEGVVEEVLTRKRVHGGNTSMTATAASQYRRELLRVARLSIHRKGGART